MFFGSMDVAGDNLWYFNEEIWPRQDVIWRIVQYKGGIQDFNRDKGVDVL